VPRREGDWVVSYGMTVTADADEIEYRERLQRALGTDFELRDLIGRGGFGSVYAAWDQKLEREVAVKALRHDVFPTRLVLDRFEREAKAVAKLRHAHILPVYAVGQGEGVAYMVMPVVRGESLRSLLQKPEPIDHSDAVRIIADVARALGAAHRLGIVHRDVKPENILLEGDDRNALLADFGIAKSSGDAGGITGTGVVLGSPHYMSPEQASADRELDGRSDIYSLGAVAYELLARRRPYEATSLQQMLVLQFTTEPAHLADVAPSVPGPVSDAVMRALARDPSQRWQTASDFASALERAATPVASTEAQPSWFARRGPLFALAYAGGLYTNLINLTLLLGRSREAIETASRVLAQPILTICIVGIFAMLIELFVLIVIARRSGLRGSALRRLAFGQPSWWQAWYPRALRAPDNVWDRMPLSMRVMRTLVWLGLVVVPLAMPIIFIVPDVAAFARGMGVPLPLPMRIMIFTSVFLRAPLLYGVGLSLLGAVALALKHRLPPLSVLRLLFTWRASAWDSPAGRRLMGTA
jgi:tRNA A-37 threonylcarbamoyl transferase component Bud32